MQHSKLTWSQKFVRNFIANTGRLPKPAKWVHYYKYSVDDLNIETFTLCEKSARRTTKTTDKNMVTCPRCIEKMKVETLI